MINVEIDTDKLNLSLSGLETFFKKGDRSMMADIKTFMSQDTFERFRLENDSDGQKWKPLSEKTLMKRRKLGRGSKILQDTGQLRGTLIGYEDSFTAKFGATREYGKYHQQGSGVPERKFLGFSSKIIKKIEMYVSDKIKSIWGGK